MLINEVCKRCGLTKKAIEYYEEQGLTRPQIMENGYRVFSEDDVIQLNKIAVLRGLGISVSAKSTPLVLCRARRTDARLTPFSSAIRSQVFLPEWWVSS